MYMYIDIYIDIERDREIESSGCFHKLGILVAGVLKTIIFGAYIRSPDL